MSSPHEYHRSNTPASLHDDHDSDLDLDLDELDPTTSSQPAPARKPQRHNRTTSYDIPLRNLRLGGLRGYKRAARRQDADAEDLTALVGDDEVEDTQKRESAASSGTGGDDAPLLRPNAGLRRFSQQSQTALSKFKSRFLSSRSGLDQPSEDRNEPDPEEHDPSTNRIISVGQRQASRFPPNAVSNAKYTPVSFLPRTLYNEFSFFFNMYFLLVALSQIIPALRIGYLSTYIVPLAFVLAITLGKEAADDIARRRRDQEANSERYQVLEFQENGEGPAGKSARRNDGGSGSSGRKIRKKRGNPQDRLSDNEDEEENTGTRPSTSVKDIWKPSRDLKVGDVLVMSKDQRFPADVVILKSFSTEASALSGQVSVEAESDTRDTPEDALIESYEQPSSAQSAPLVNQTTSEDPSAGGEAFIRTDQLDGETDWKLRLASPLTQDLAQEEFARLRATAGKPDKNVNEFVGTLELLPKPSRVYDPYISKNSKSGDANQVDNQSSHVEQDAKSIPLSIDNTAWANTVLASSSTVLAVIIYTGPQTRAALSTSQSRSKTGLLEYEINSLTKILCFLTLALSFILVALEGFESKDGRKWYVAVMRFLILFSTIVPISLRVNLDMGKSVYAWFIERDQGIPDTVVRTSTIPEDLGRIEYLLSDKTGTLTQNGKPCSIQVVFHS